MRVNHFYMWLANGRHQMIFARGVVSSCLDPSVALKNNFFQNSFECTEKLQRQYKGLPYTCIQFPLLLISCIIGRAHLLKINEPIMRYYYYQSLHFIQSSLVLSLMLFFCSGVPSGIPQYIQWSCLLRVLQDGTMDQLLVVH